MWPEIGSLEWLIAKQVGTAQKCRLYIIDEGRGKEEKRVWGTKQVGIARFADSAPCIDEGMGKKGVE
jgi:hypothetical protein